MLIKKFIAGFDKAGFGNSNNFLKILYEHKLCYRTVYKHKDSFWIHTFINVWHNEEKSLVLTTSGNPLMKNGQSQYIGIEGKKNNVLSLFEEIKKMESFEEDESVATTEYAPILPPPKELISPDNYTLLFKEKLFNLERLDLILEGFGTFSESD